MDHKQALKNLIGGWKVAEWLAWLALEEGRKDSFHEWNDISFACWKQAKWIEKRLIKND